MKKLLIIDGNSILNRAFYGIRMLNAPDGTPTNAVYGFLNILFKNLDEDMPDYLCVAFDVKEKTFRHKMYDQYKAQRKPAPEDFLVQLPLIKEILKAMNCVCLEKGGYEADDIIGTVARICQEASVECSILTGDKDDLQLASDLVKIKLVTTRMGNTQTEVFGESEVLEKYSVTPLEFIDVKALMGDSSDNIPGVKGIGEKTAFSLIEKYKNIDKIYEDIDSIDASDSVKNKLKDGKDLAYISKELATIDRFVPISFDVEDCKIKETKSKELFDIFNRLNFKSFIEKFGLNEVQQKEDIFEGKSTYLDKDSFLKSLNSVKMAAYRLYTQGTETVLSVSPDEDTYWTVENPDDELLARFFQDENIKKIGFNVKDDILWLKNHGIDFLGLMFDVAVAAYLIDPARSEYDIEGLAFGFLGLIPVKSSNETEDGQFFLDFDEKSEENDKSAYELYALSKLYLLFKKKLEENNQTELYNNIELPLIEVLADMQHTGVFVDRQALLDFGDKTKKSIKLLEEQIYEAAGRTFNINSPKQLGEILFEELKLPHGKKTKTGYSTSVYVLKKLEGVHPIIENIMEYRALSKLQSTYVEGLLNVINEKTGRIHSNFNQTVTATGRISSTEPNLQNIPVRTERGREMRRMFVAEGSNTLIDADYSQIELRVLSHIAGDDNMKSAFLNGVDIHTQTAAQVFGVSVDQVTPNMRTAAKAVNFGIVYGIGEFSLAQDLKISVKEAKQYIENYLLTYPEIKKYMTDIVSEGKNKGYVTTLLGRRRYIPELRTANRMTQAFGERIAMNAPIQGTAADIIKIAMVNVYKRLKKEGLKSKLILQVHDELIVEAEVGEEEKAMEILLTEMENALKLSVPLKVDCNKGKTWYDTK